MANLDLPRPVGFVLGGGGSLGSAQVGMLRALREAGVHPDLVVGTSVGAVNGSLLAARPDDAPARLAAVWQDMRREHVFPGGRFTTFVTARSAKTFLYSNDALFDILRQHLPVDTFEQLAIPFAAVAVDVEAVQPVVLRQGLVAPAVVASAAIPGVYPPVWHNGRWLYDGGLLANLPLRQALDLGARSLVVLDCFFPGRPSTVPVTMAEVLAFTVLAVSHQQAAAELPHASREVPVVYLPGPAFRRVSPLDFQHTASLLEEAHEVAARFLDGLRVDGPGLYGPLPAPTGEPVLRPGTAG